jgi:hypothetical protein
VCTSTRPCACSASQSRARAALAAERRRLYPTRFEVLGGWWVRCLRHLRFGQSLRVAFETPAQFSLAHADQTYLIPRRQFVAAWTYALERDAAVMPQDAFEEFLDTAWALLDVGATGTGDYRELLAALALFRLSPEHRAEDWVLAAFRAYDGDARGGVSHTDLRCLLCSLATSAAEVERVMAAGQWAALSGASDDGADGAAPTRPGAPAEDDWMLSSTLGRLRPDSERVRREAIARRKAQLAMRAGAARLAEPDAVTGEARTARARTGWATERDVRHLVANSPALVAELDTQILARLPAVLRAERTVARLAAARAAADAQVQRLHAELTWRDAVLAWTHSVQRRVFAAWKAEVLVAVLLRRAHKRHRTRRAVRTWFAATRARRRRRAQALTAFAQSVLGAQQRSFAAWVQWLHMRRAANALAQQRACAAHAWTLRERVFGAWHALAAVTRAARHCARVQVRTAFRAWTSARPALRAERDARAAARAAGLVDGAGGEADGDDEAARLRVAALGPTASELEQVAEEELLRAERKRAQLKADAEFAEFERLAKVAAVDGA